MFGHCLGITHAMKGSFEAEHFPYRMTSRGGQHHALEVLGLGWISPIQPQIFNWDTESGSIAGGVRDVESVGFFLDVSYAGNGLRRMSLPGATLAHGYQAAFDKAMLMVWMLWLVAGPDIKLIEYLCERVRCFTTDGGVESHIPDMWNALPAFARSLGTACSVTFMAFEYMFPYAVVILDWSHLMDTILAGTFADLACWPNTLRKLKLAAAFFKVEENRNVIRFHLRSSFGNEYDELMKSFTASFAHWRFETISTSVSQTVRYRFLCEELFDETWFKNLRKESQATLDGIVELCADTEFWKSITAFERFTAFMEHLRQWGTGCDCHAVQRRLGQLVDCNRASRNLQFAAAKRRDSLEELLTLAKSITYDGCERSHMVFADMQFIGRRLHAEFKLRTAWIANPPYTYANCCDPDTAKLIIHECKGRSWDRVSDWLYARFKDKLEIVSTGGPLPSSDALFKEQAVWRNMLMSSQLAEGYHRSTRLNKIRASSSRMPWTLSTQRLLEDLALLQEYSTGDMRKVFEYDYENYSRILQPNPRLSLRPVRKKPLRVFSEVYRLGDFARTPWLDIARQMGIVRKKEKALPALADAPLSDKLLVNFILSSISANRFYFIYDSESGEPMYFHVLRTNTASWHVANHEAVGAGPRALIQPYTKFDGSAFLETHVYAEEEPFEVELVTLAPKKDWYELICWDFQASDYDDCILLINKQKVRQIMSLEDARCAMWVLIKHLRTLGWKPTDGKVVHKPDGRKLHSADKIMSSEYYLRCLLQLDTLFNMGLSELRSGLTHAYYKFLDLECRRAGAVQTVHGRP